MLDLLWHLLIYVSGAFSLAFVAFIWTKISAFKEAQKKWAGDLAEAQAQARKLESQVEWFNAYYQDNTKAQVLIQHMRRENDRKMELSSLYRHR